MNFVVLHKTSQFMIFRPEVLQYSFQLDQIEEFIHLLSNHYPFYFVFLFKNE